MTTTAPAGLPISPQPHMGLDRVLPSVDGSSGPDPGGQKPPNTLLRKCIFMLIPRVHGWSAKGGADSTDHPLPASLYRSLSCLPPTAPISLLSHGLAVRDV